jgi:hypothetical protein
MMISWTLGAIVGNVFARTPFMMLFLMHDYLGALIWAGVDSVLDVWKKVRKYRDV